MSIPDLFRDSRFQISAEKSRYAPPVSILLHASTSFPQVQRCNAALRNNCCELFRFHPVPPPPQSLHLVIACTLRRCELSNAQHQTNLLCASVSQHCLSQRLIFCSLSALSQPACTLRTAQLFLFAQPAQHLQGSFFFLLSYLKTSSNNQPIEQDNHHLAAGLSFPLVLVFYLCFGCFSWLVYFAH